METTSTVNEQPIRYPEGRTSAIWFRNGYRAAMSDIYDLLLSGADTDQIAQWVRDNG